MIALSTAVLMLGIVRIGVVLPAGTPVPRPGVLLGLSPLFFVAAIMVILTAMPMALYLRRRG